MHDSLISKRYAEALMSLSLEMKNVEEVLGDMKQVEKLCKADREFVLFLKSPVIKPEKKQRALKAAFEGKVTELTLRFLSLITKHRREPILEQIARQYGELYKEHNHIITTYLTTASKVTEEVKKEVIELMEEHTKGRIELVEEVDEGLIGGFKLQFSDKEFDSSLRKAVDNLKKEFKKNLFIREI